MAKIQNPKNWFVKLFTFGKNFNSKNFSDNFKKYVFEFIGLFAAVTFSFYVESVGDEYEKKQRYKEIVSSIPSRIKKTINYSNQYLELSNEMNSSYEKVIENWKVNSDSIFILKYNEIDFYPPLAYYFLVQDYNPPLLNFELFKSGDQEFKMLYKQVSIEINELIDGNKLNNIISIKDQERNLAEKYNELIYEELGTDFDISNVFTTNFWINNRRDIQENYKLKFLIKERIRLTKEIIDPRITSYKSFLEKKSIYFDSINKSFLEEQYFLYWRIN